MSEDGRVFAFGAVAVLAAAGLVRSVGSRTVRLTSSTLSSSVSLPKPPISGWQDVHEYITSSAAKHGRENEPDHEMGDLQGALQIIIERFLDTRDLLRFVARAFPVDEYDYIGGGLKLRQKIQRKIRKYRHGPMSDGEAVYLLIWDYIEDQEKLIGFDDSVRLVHHFLKAALEVAGSEGNLLSILETYGDEVGFEDGVEPPNWYDRPNRLKP